MKKQKKAKPVIAWGFKGVNGALKKDSAPNKKIAEIWKKDGEKVVRVKITEV